MPTGFCQQDVRAMKRFTVRDRGKTHAAFLVRPRDELLVEEFRRGGLAGERDADHVFGQNLLLDDEPFTLQRAQQT
jgi:hypothetical protein